LPFPDYKRNGVLEKSIIQYDHVRKPPQVIQKRKEKTSRVLV